MVASDAHRASGNRICKLSDAYKLVVDEIGEKNANILFYENPLHIIRNEELEYISVVKKKSFFDRLRRR